MMKNKFYINLIIILLVVMIVLYFSLKDNFNEIVYHISNMSILWFIISILVLIIYRIVIGVSSYIICKINCEQVNILKIIQINFIILFFHGITPFSGGGQPMEIYYLYKEGISKTKSTNIVLQNFIIFQTALIIVSFLAVIYNNYNNLFLDDSLMKKLVILGFLINFLVWLFSFIISFCEKINKFVFNKVLKFLGKIKLVKNVSTLEEKLNNYIVKFYDNALLLKKQKKKVVISLILNIIALIILYSIPYTVSLGMGVTNLSYINILVATTYVMMIGSFIPIPGGTGGIEYGFMYFAGYFISGGLLAAIMLVWRFISYYLAMILGAIALVFYRKKEKVCE